MWLPLCCSIVKGTFLLMIYLESMPWWSPPGGRPLVVAQYASPFAASPCHPEPQRRVCLHGPPDASPRSAGPGSACSHLFWSSLPLLTPLTLLAFDELF